MIPRLAAPVQASGAATRGRVRIASLNVWALARPLARDVAERMVLIGGALGELNADLVAFQEVWTAAAGRALLAAGRAAGLDHAWNGQRETGGSGLVALSRWPIERTAFEAFATRGLPERFWHGDYWGAKGFGTLRVTTPAGPLAFVDTHLHAQYDENAYPEYHTHRMGQVVQLSAALAPIDVPTIAAGDFNMRPDAPEYRALAGLSGLRDVAAEAGDPRPTSLRANPYNRDDESDARIDYVFARDGARRALRVLRAERAFDGPIRIGGREAALSDHAGLLVDLEISPKRGGAGAPTPHPDPEAVALARETLARGIELARARRGDHRLGAASALALGVGGLAAGRVDALTRRRLLRRSLAAVAALSSGSGLAWGAFGELSVRREIGDYDQVLRALDRLAGAP